MREKVWSFLRENPIPPFILIGLAAGVAFRWGAGQPEIARWIWLAALLLGGAPLVWRTVRGMLRGIAAMQAWLHAATPAEIAATVAPCFVDLDRALLERAIARYRGLGIWSRTPHFPPKAFETLAESIFGCGAIPRQPGFAECTDTAIEAEALHA